MATFEEALQNAVSVLPAGVKNHPGVYVEATAGIANVMATDGYVYVCTMAPADEVTFHGFLSKAQAKDVLSAESPLDALVEQVAGIDQEALGNLLDLRSMALNRYYDVTAVILRYVPDRFKKLGALKPQGEYIDTWPAEECGNKYVRFRYGRNTIGVFTLLDPEEELDGGSTEDAWD